MYIQSLATEEPVFYRTLCDTGIFRTRAIFQTLSNICYGEFYSESCVTLAYLKLWYIQSQIHIDNTVKHLSWNILFNFLYNPDNFGLFLKTSIFRTLRYLRWSVLLRTLYNCSIFRRLIYSKHSLIQNASLSVTP